MDAFTRFAHGAVRGALAIGAVWAYLQLALFLLFIAAVASALVWA